MKDSDYPYVSGQTKVVRKFQLYTRRNKINILYIIRQSGACKYDANKGVVKVADYYLASDEKPDAIKELLALFGPVAAYVDAGTDWQAYK